jgi:hypothetical protein
MSNRRVDCCLSARCRIGKGVDQDQDPAVARQEAALRAGGEAARLTSNEESAPLKGHFDLIPVNAGSRDRELQLEERLLRGKEQGPR